MDDDSVAVGTCNNLNFGSGHQLGVRSCLHAEWAASQRSGSGKPTRVFPEGERLALYYAHPALTLYKIALLGLAIDKSADAF